jgi:threonine dehydratase
VRSQNGSSHRSFEQWYDPMPVSLAAIEDASRRIAGTALRTPLVRLNGFGISAEIYLKLENLQPIGSFKIRGAANAMAHLSPAQGM